MELKYKKETIENILKLLNTIEVKGVLNCSSLLQIHNALQNPIQENKNLDKNQNLKEG